MKILAPVNNPGEVDRIIQAGADELYCGLLPPEWRKDYAVIASANRREWISANLTDPADLREVVRRAHNRGVPVFFALNALYTAGQLPRVFDLAELAQEAGADALIVADLGLLRGLKERGFGLTIHLSTGGTVFNPEAARFYEELGVSRIVLPRHMTIEEIGRMVVRCPSVKFEVFILNSGCRNIDGFCTFHHGVRELLHRQAWNVPKRLNLDRCLLDLIRRLPGRLGRAVRGGIAGIDSACLFDYAVSLVSAPEGATRQEKREALKRVSSSFSLLAGADPCGACRLKELSAAGVYGVKIVGRNYSTAKKVRDSAFLKSARSYAETGDCGRKEFYAAVRKMFSRFYGMDCGGLCYYPDGM